jgi:hypothetical protein
MHSVLRTIFLFILAAFGGILSFSAQDPVTRHFTVDEGLPSNEVYDILEDSLGYIWFATDHGISRFDGYSFKNYSTSDGLTHNTVFGFFEDNQHKIWMRTLNGSLCFMENGRIHPYTHNDSLKKFLGGYFIQTFAIDSIGDLWFMSIRESYGLFHQDHKTGKIKKIKLKNGFNAFIRELGNNNFIAGVDLDNGNDEKTRLDTNLVYEDHTWLFHIKYNEANGGRGLVRSATSFPGHYLFSFNSQIVEFADNKLLKQFSLPNENPVGYVYSDNNKKFWLTGKGLMSYVTDTQKVFYRDILIHSVKQDQHGSYWLATGNKGVFYIPDMGIMELKPDGFEELNLITRLEEQLYAVFDRQGLLTIPLSSSGPTSRPTTLLTPDENFKVYDVFMNTLQKQLFLGQRRFSIRSVKKNFPAKLEQPKYFGTGIGFIRSIVAKDDRIFAVGNKNWGIFDEQGNNIYSSEKDGFFAFWTAVCVDSSNKVWIGSTDGLFVFNSGHTATFRHQDSIFRTNVSDIECMPDGEIIVSTRGKGVIVIDKEKVYNINTTMGLTTDLCGKIVVEDNLFWVCSNNGLNRIKVRRLPDQTLTFEITRIQMDNGLPSNLVNDALRYKDLIILAAGKGLTWFNVKNFAPHHSTPPVYFNDVMANRRKITNDITLYHDETNLSFSFIGLLYNSAGQLQYRYRLEGYENEWHYTSDRNVRYFNLPAGSYKFVVAAMNENGMWSARSATFTFLIPPHFSKTWWFRLILGSFIILCIWMIVLYYINQRRLKGRITSGMLMAELKTLRSQMKPHFIFNSLSSIQHFILESNQEAAHLYLSRFSNLMRKILENTQKNTISLAREIETLDLYLLLEKLRFSGNFEYTIAIAEDIVPDTIEVPPMLIQPYVENAIWHGLLVKKEDAHLSLRFFRENGTTLVCEIQDNGVGRVFSSERKRNGSHQSTGIKNIQERIDILNRISNTPISAVIIDLYTLEGKSCGTKVVLKLTNALNVTVNT